MPNHRVLNQIRDILKKIRIGSVNQSSWEMIASGTIDFSNIDEDLFDEIPLPDQKDLKKLEQCFIEISKKPEVTKADFWEMMSSPCGSYVEATDDEGANLAVYRSVLGLLLRGMTRRYQPEGARYHIPESSAWTACACYLSLICVPGGVAYGAFVPSFYSQAVLTIKSFARGWLSMGTKAKSKGGSNLKSGQEAEESEEEEEETSSAAGSSGSLGSAAVKGCEELINLLPLVFRAVALTPEQIRQAVDALAAALSLATSRPPAARLEGVVAKALVDIMAQSPEAQRAAVGGAVLKGLLPLLLLAKGSADAPTTNRARIHAHNASMKVVFEVGEEFHLGAAVAAGVAAQGESEASEPAATSLASTTYSPLLAVAQHLCMSLPDRAEARARVADALFALLKKLPPQDRKRMLRFLARFSRCSKTIHRGLAIEMIQRVLMDWENMAPEESSEKQGPDTSRKADKEVLPRRSTRSEAAEDEAAQDEEESKDEVEQEEDLLSQLFFALVARCSDKMSTVRAKAVTALSQIMSWCASKDRASQPEAARVLQDTVAKYAGWGTDCCLEDSPVYATLTRRIRDEKAAARRAAILGLEALAVIWLGRPNSSVKEVEDAVGLLAKRCNDQSVACRKQAAVGLSAVLAVRPVDPFLQDIWVRSVLPLIGDPEQGLQNRVLELLRQVVIDRVAAWHHSVNEKRRNAGRRRSFRNEQTDKEKDEGLMSVWHLLCRIASSDLRQCLQSAVSKLASQKEGPSLRPLLQALTAAAVMALPDRSVEGTESQTLQLNGEEQQAGTCGTPDKHLPTTEGGHVAEDEDPDLAVLRRGCWVLLEALLANTDEKVDPTALGCRLDPSFVVECWTNLRWGIDQRVQGQMGSPALEEDCRRVLKVLAALAPRVEAEVAAELADGFLDQLLALQHVPETSGAMIRALHHLCYVKASEEDALKTCESWTSEVLSVCREVIQTYVLGSKEKTPQLEQSGELSGLEINAPPPSLPGELSATLVERAVYCVGEISMVGFNLEEDSTGRGPTLKDGNEKKLLFPRVSRDVIKLIQVLLSPNLPDQDGIQGKSVPDFVRAQAYIAIGKLCLRRSDLAKSCVALFVRELTSGHSPAVRSNCLVALIDMTVRFTNLVDRHIPAMARCLQDQHVLVRRHAMLLISQLLLQDYVKWRGLLLQRFLACLADNEPSVAALADHLICTPLLHKFPQMFQTHFVETIFVLNNYEEHAMFKAAMKQGAEAGGAVTMEGVAGISGSKASALKNRNLIYTTMLRRLNGEQKIHVTGKLAHDILGSCVDGSLPVVGTKGKGGLPEEVRAKAEGVVRDTLRVLASPDIKIIVRGGKGGLDDEFPVEEEAQASTAEQMAAAKGRLLSKMNRKHLLENVVPVLISLKHTLEQGHSPLLKDLMHYFQELFKAYKEEMKEVLSADPTLAMEIEYDLKQYEKQAELERQAQELAEKEKEARASMGPPLNNTPFSNRKGRQSLPASGFRNAITPNRTSLGAGIPTPRLTQHSVPRLRRASMGPEGILRTPSQSVNEILSAGKKAPSMRSAHGRLSLPYKLASDDLPLQEDQSFRKADITMASPDLAPASRRRWSVTLAPSDLDSKSESTEPSSRPSQSPSLDSVEEGTVQNMMDKFDKVANANQRIIKEECKKHKPKSQKKSGQKNRQNKEQAEHTEENTGSSDQGNQKRKAKKICKKVGIEEEEDCSQTGSRKVKLSGNRDDKGMVGKSKRNTRNSVSRIDNPEDAEAMNDMQRKTQQPSSSKKENIDVNTGATTKTRRSKRKSGRSRNGET